MGNRGLLTCTHTIYLLSKNKKNIMIFNRKLTVLQLEKKQQKYIRWACFRNERRSSCAIRPSLKKCFCLALPTQGFTWWVGRSPFFLNIYYLHMDGNGKKNLRFGEKKLSSSKTGESVGNAKQTFFFFGLTAPLFSLHRQNNPSSSKIRN